MQRAPFGVALLFSPFLLERFSMKLTRKWRENFPIKNCRNLFLLYFAFDAQQRIISSLQQKNTFYAHVVWTASSETCSDFKVLIYFMTNIKIAEMPCSQMTHNESHSVVANNKLTLGLRFSTSFSTWLPIYCLVCIHFRVNLITFLWTANAVRRVVPSEMHRTEWKKTAFPSASFA